MFVGVMAACYLHMAEFLFGMTTDTLKLSCAIDDVHRQSEAIYLVVDS